MSHNNAKQARASVSSFGFSMPTPTGASTFQQSAQLGARPVFSSGGNLPAAHFIFGQSTISRQVEDVDNFEMSSAPGNSSSETLVKPKIYYEERLKILDLSITEKYLCHSCETIAHLMSGFWCDGCYGFQHKACGGNILFAGINGTIPNLFDHFGLAVCKNCDSQLRNSTPAPFPTTRPLCAPSPEKIDNVNGKNNDARTMLRRSRRDPEQIARCKSPDQVIITAEHFTTEAETPLFKSALELTSNESDDPMMEALFEINDSVLPTAFARDQPDHSRPFKVVARYFNNKEYSEDDDAFESDTDNGESDTSREESTLNEVDDHNIPDVFGKHGWFYKLERSPTSNAVAVAKVIFWHEDSLKLALEDDSDDDMDPDPDDEKEVKVKEEVVTQETVVEKTVTEQKIVSEEQSRAARARSLLDRLVNGTFDSGLEIPDDDDNGEGPGAGGIKRLES